MRIAGAGTHTSLTAHAAAATSSGSTNANFTKQAVRSPPARTAPSPPNQRSSYTRKDRASSAGPVSSTRAARLLRSPRKTKGARSSN